MRKNNTIYLEGPVEIDGREQQGVFVTKEKFFELVRNGKVSKSSITDDDFVPYCETTVVTEIRNFLANTEDPEETDGENRNGRNELKNLRRENATLRAEKTELERVKNEELEAASAKIKELEDAVKEKEAIIKDCVEKINKGFVPSVGEDDKPIWLFYKKKVAINPYIAAGLCASGLSVNDFNYAQGVKLGNKIKAGKAVKDVPFDPEDFK